MYRRFALSLLALIPGASWRAMAQVQMGPFTANLSGNVTGGYTADFGTGGSDHGFNAGGLATLSGAFYDPGFLTYTVQPFYNQSWANSTSQSLTSSSGITAGTGLFTGGDYPGSVNYSRIYNSTGNFNIPGVANFTTHGDSDTFSVGWGEHIEGLPVISVNYSQGSGAYTVYGGSGDLTNTFRTASGTINYTVAGFAFFGNYRFFENQSNIPEILGEEQEQVFDRSNSVIFGVSHKLPFNGSFGGSVGRTYMNSDYTNGGYNGTLDTVTASLGFNPIDRLNINTQGIYNDNLLASLYAPLIAAGAAPEASVLGQNSHSLDITSIANYRVPKWHLTFIGDQQYRAQEIFGYGLKSNLYTGMAVYSNLLWNGYLTVTGGGTYTTINPGGQDTTGFISSGNYTRNVHRWQMTFAGNYNRNAETALIDYTTNSYGYSVLLGRKFENRKYWSVSASGNKSALVQQSNYGTFSQTYASSFSWKGLVTATGAFTHSSGNGTLTAAGISSASTLLPVVSPTGVLLFGGTSYTASVGANPIRGLTLSASYSHSLVSTTADSTNTSGRTEQFSALFSYILRKIVVQGGYLRLSQGFGESGVTPVNLDSLYVGLMRWFNFF